MKGMGRPKTKNLDLPPRLSPRKLKTKTLYYYCAGQGRIPLGSDLNEARTKWAEYENGGTAAATYLAVAARFEAEYLPHLSVVTQKQYKGALKELAFGFEKFAFDQIEPSHVRNYLDLRTKKMSANREIAVLSIMWNFARSKGITKLSNPCMGIKRHTQHARSRYVREEEYQKAWDAAPEWLRDAMDLALLTGQRPSDVLKMKRQDVYEGALWVKQGKTGTRLRIMVKGELKDVLARIQNRQKGIESFYLISDNKGQPINIWRLDKAFAKIRGGDWQFRDLRAKTVTDETDLRTASQRAGHADEMITAKVYRRVKGNLVDPLK